MKRYSQYIMYALFLLFGLGCDEGKIYPDETVDSGRTATVSLSFTGLKAWPKENMLSLCAFGEDKSKPLQTQRTEMLYRMYNRWAAAHGMTVEVLDYQDGDYRTDPERKGQCRICSAYHRRAVRCSICFHG